MDIPFCSKEQASFDANNVTPIFQEFHSRHVDGIIWAVPEVGENRTWVNKPPSDVNIPIVFLTMEPQENISVVSTNNYLGGRMAMSHLLEQGYRHIGHISGPLDWWEARQRMAAWKDGLEGSGHKVSGIQIGSRGTGPPSSGAQAVEKLFEQYPEMDSIFVANDQMALSVIQAACQKKLRIPEDIGIVGFDNIAELAFFCPPLTTIQIDQYNVGKVAVEEIVKIIESGWQEQEPQSPNPLC